jgi:hypothetical protein
MEAAKRKTKNDLLLEYDILDVLLSDSDKRRMKEIRTELDNILKQEEIKAWQRSRDRSISEGDRNTSNFHAIANQWKRKKMISVLDGPCGPVETTKEMLEVASNFYKNLFAFEEGFGIHLGPNFWDPEDQVTLEDNALLEKPFSEEEIRNAVFESYASGAPGPDGLSFLFYQKNWDVIKNDFMALVRDFDSGNLNAARFNYTIVTLILKEPDAREMKKYRPISLGNYSLKIISKAITNRIAPIGDRIIAKNQTAFIKGRFILESVVAAQKLIHAVHSKGDSALVLKLDYEKAYDRVDWDFLDDMLSSRGLALFLGGGLKAYLLENASVLELKMKMAPFSRLAKV